jgi:VanZ family protein
MDERHELIRQYRFRRFGFFGGPVLAYAALIYFLSSLSHLSDDVQVFSGFDKVAHFFEYYFFGCLIYRWFSSTDPNGKRTMALVMTILVGIFYGLSDEWHQSFVPGRDASLWDALFDALGVATGAAFYRWFRQRESSLKAGSDRGPF